MKIETLVVGLGKIGMLYDYKKKKHYNNHCDAIKNHSFFKLVGGVDIDKKKRNLFIKKYNLPVFIDTKKAFDKINPKMLILSTPTKKNNQIFKLILKKKINPKIILLEKPGTYVYSELNKLCKFCINNKIKLFLNYTRSYSKIIGNLHKNLLSKKFKKVGRVEVFYYKGIFNSCSHYIHFLCSVFKFNKIKIKKITRIKKIKDDFLVNFILDIGREVYFYFSEKKINEKILFNYNDLKIQYNTGTSKIYDHNKQQIRNDFNYNLKNVLDRIKTYKKKDINSSLNKSLVSLKTICKITEHLNK